MELTAGTLRRGCDHSAKGPASPLHQPGWARLGCTAQTKAPPEGRGFLSSNGPACEGGCGNGSRPATTTPSRRVGCTDCRHGRGGLAGTSTRIEGRRLTSPIRAEPDKPAASTGGPAVGCEEEISLRRHPRNSRSTLLPIMALGLFRCALHLGFRLSSLLRFVANLVILSSCNPSPVLFSAACALLSHHDLPAKRCQCR